MHKTVSSLYNTALTALKIIFERSRGIDHKLLSHYIVKINQLHDIDSIIYQASRCLYYMLDYEFFAFAMYDREFNGGIDIWIDPRTENITLINHIKQDFMPRNLNCNIRYFESDPGVGEDSSFIDISSMIAQTVIDNRTRARLYLAPRRPMLQHHNELLMIIVKSLATAISNYISFKKLENAALIDPLTHCYNRRALDGHIDHDIASSERYGSDLAVISFDIDHFKTVNDTFGHSAGDAVLRAVSKSVMSAIRKSDYLARVGGEEFMLLLPKTKFSKAIELAERLRKIIENLKIRYGDKNIQVTASFGVGVYKKGMGKDAFLKRADDMLYEAKRKGRNRIKPDLRLYHNVLHNSPGEKPFPQ